VERSFYREIVNLKYSFGCAIMIIIVIVSFLRSQPAHPERLSQLTKPPGKYFTGG